MLNILMSFLKTFRRSVFTCVCSVVSGILRKCRKQNSCNITVSQFSFLQKSCTPTMMMNGGLSPVHPSLLNVSFFRAGRPLWTLQTSLREQKQTNHIVTLFTVFHDLLFRHLLLLLIHGLPKSQWFLTSYQGKSGGYMLIPLIWPFSSVQPQRERDHKG